MAQILADLFGRAAAARDRRYLHERTLLVVVGWLGVKKRVLATMNCVRVFLALAGLMKRFAHVAPSDLGRFAVVNIFGCVTSIGHCLRKHPPVTKSRPFFRSITHTLD